MRETIDLTEHHDIPCQEDRTPSNTTDIPAYPSHVSCYTLDPRDKIRVHTKDKPLSVKGDRYVDRDIPRRFDSIRDC
jgi:hypothetical protein